MSKFDLVAMGGTFDIIHKGHIRLLSEAFSISSKVIIGLTSDELAEKRGKKTLNNYEKRFETLMNTIKTNFPNRAFQISKLDNDFGPAVLEENVQALIVSDETGNQGEILNQLRAEKN
ncbi:MAG: pantetheine-phosphate adenylyltransferase, partial [Thermoproteota archaeon]